MPDLADLITGKTVGVSSAELPFVAPPGGRLQLPATVMMVSPDGDVFAAPGNDPKVRQALSLGWRIESPDETKHREVVKKYGDSDIRTGLEGAASAATLGLSDVLQTKLGLVPKEDLAGRREANPEAYTAGQIGGLAASLLVPGAAPGALLRGAEATSIARTAGIAARAITAPVRGAEALSKAAAASVGSLLPAAAGSSTMARMLSAGAKLGTQGVVDGAIFGTGQLVSEHALGDTELNAERVLSHIGMSALASGAMGVGLGGVMGVASPAASAARKKLLENIEKIPGISRESVAEELKTQSHKAALASVSALGGLIKKLKKQGLSELGPEALFEINAPDGKPIIQGFRDAHQLSARLDDTADMLGQKIRAPISALDAAGVDAGITAKELADRVKANILDSYKDQIGAKEASNLAKKEIKQLLSMGKQGPETLRIDKDLGFVKVPGEMQYQNVTHGWLQDMRQRMASGYEQDKVADEARRAIERELNSALESSLKKNLDADAFKDYMDAKKGFHSIAAIQKATGNRVATLDGNAYFALRDRITSGATQAMYGGIQGGLEGAAGAALPLTQGALLGLGAAAISRQVRTRSASALAIFLNKASKMMAVENAVQKAAKAEASVLDQAVGQLFSTGRAVSTPKEIDSALIKGQAFDIMKMADDPQMKEKVKREIEMSIGEVAPEITDGLASKVVAGISFLASKAPRDESSPLGTLTPGVESKWEPSKSQAMTYSRYVDAVNNPTKVISDIANGRLNHEGMEVLGTLYPSLRNDLVTRFVERIGASKTPIPYNKRVALAVLLGVPNADPTLLPEYIASMQDGFKKQPAAQQQPQPITNNAARSMEKNREQDMTQTDRIASGQE